METVLSDIRLIDYPYFSNERSSLLKNSLFEKGVTEIYSFGKVEIGSDRAIGKGNTSIIFLGKYKHEKVSIKIERSDSERKGSLKKEASFLIKANENGVGPKIYDYEDNYIIMEYVEGNLLIEGKFDRADIFDISRQCNALDKAGINHRQIQGGKHIICGKKNVIIDFEKAHFSNNPKNVTSFLSMCFLSDCLVRERIKKIFNFKEDWIKSVLKEYKSNSNIEDLISNIQ
ncbi:MAG: bifunctional UGMP family protein/serine/threonine protein kinase [Candidatus Methanofastidiosum methylothiophilum]|uniref:Bifunctional UGMP family protein/serine/threonine protein kinase n=1 Tax=Candidatus Methanofastidiosum methylothiophilum TaxID=1705564 RepID=A0A150IL95_9EURY|nr:MAG: bifunctional UGMP family protein/serine/threonine protein kinase [Candidatus Methanofastidiosum methylthiophilus]KYC47953.1 MAG: bifunctional UGMP family protein/serine/threonine protein kinase [Candidatus Methanofastidiosum methylthiophilus]KYC50571.1 MAG: bifunctional UGMP family protein/serine/threonine protein kinase [Candidatus Methanofastidiosum methylthiophilus]